MMPSDETGFHRQERYLREQRERAVHELQDAERSARRWRIWAAVQVLIVAAHVVWLSLAPTWWVVIGAAVWAVAAGLALFLNLPQKRQVVANRRRSLELVDGEYDQAFARMIAAEGL